MVAREVAAPFTGAMCSHTQSEPSGRFASASSLLQELLWMLPIVVSSANFLLGISSSSSHCSANIAGKLGKLSFLLWPPPATPAPAANRNQSDHLSNDYPYLHSFGVRQGELYTHFPVQQQEGRGGNVD